MNVESQLNINEINDKKISLCSYGFYIGPDGLQ